MSDATGTKFSCDGCGRTYAWKEQLAGKRVKCKCGTAIAVPQSEPEPEFDADALYALADAEKEAAANAPSQHRVVERSAPVKAAPAAAKGPGIPRGAAGLAVGYQRGPTARDVERGNSIIDMKRDLYAPLGLLVGGLIIYVAYYAIRYQLHGRAILAVMFGLFLLTLLKAALLIGFALVMAGPMGVSFGGIWSAALKLASIAVVNDALTTWVSAGFEKLAPGSGGLLGALVAFPVSLVVVASLLIYLFSMDPGDSWFVVFVLAAFDFIMRWVLILLLLAVIMNWGGISLPGAIGGGGGAMSNDPLAVEVQEYKDQKMLQEASKYIEEGHQEILRPYVADWYKLGCKNIWFVVSGGPSGVIVELPKDKSSRDKCFELVKKYYDGATIGYNASTLKDDGSRYMEVRIKTSH